MWVSGNVIPSGANSEFSRRLKLKLSKLIQPSRVHHEALQKVCSAWVVRNFSGACPQRVLGSYIVR